MRGRATATGPARGPARASRRERRADRSAVEDSSTKARRKNNRGALPRPRPPPRASRQRGRRATPPPADGQQGRRARHGPARGPAGSHAGRAGCVVAARAARRRGGGRAQTRTQSDAASGGEGSGRPRNGTRGTRARPMFRASKGRREKQVEFTSAVRRQSYRRQSIAAPPQTQPNRCTRHPPPCPPHSPLSSRPV